MENKKRVKYGKKYGAIFIIVLVFSFSFAFADDSCTISESTKAFGDVLTEILKLLSRFWIIIAKIDGRLMTNDFIYGSILNLDTYLWKIWQIVRTFANYAIGLYFLYVILKYMFFSDKGDFTKVLKNLLFASVSVQASRFLIMATVDISTITLAAVSSFPAQIMAGDAIFTEKIRDNLMSSELLGKDVLGGKNIVTVQVGKKAPTQVNKIFNMTFTEKASVAGEEGDKLKIILDEILPKPSDLSGPFMYFGTVILKLFEQAQQPSLNKSCNSLTELAGNIANFIINGGITIFYSIALLVLLVVLVARLIFLWLFICFSPLIVLKYFIKVKIRDDLIDIKKAIGLIFQPVMFAVCISLMFVVITVLKSFITINSQFSGIVTINESPGSAGNTTTTELKIGDQVKMVLKDGSKGFKDIMISIITLALMYWFVMLAITQKTGIKSLDNFTQKIGKSAGDFMGSVGVIPTPAGKIGLRNLNPSNSEILSSLERKIDRQISDTKYGQKNKIRQLFGMEIGTRKLTSGESDLLFQNIRTSGPINDEQKFNATRKKISDIQNNDKNNGIYLSDIEKSLAWIIANNQRNGKLPRGDFDRDDSKSSSDTETALTKYFKDPIRLAELKALLRVSENNNDEYSVLRSQAIKPAKTS